MPSSAAPTRILLIQLRYMGDVLLCTPALRAVRSAYPGARIEFLTAAPGADALAGNPHTDELLVWRPGWRQEWGLKRELRRRRYDLVVDFQSTPRTARLVRATRAARRLGTRGRGPRNLSYTDLVPRERGPVYTALQKLRVLTPLGSVPSERADLSLEIVIGTEERKRAEAIWREHGLDGEAPVVAISPVSREHYKQWGAERWAEVADALAEAGARVLITSGPGEREQVEAVVRRMRHPAVWEYGRTTLRELAALYERCALWLGNDGGPKHVAAAAGTPTITVIRWQIGPMWTDAAAATPHTFLDAPPPQGCDQRCERCAHLGCLGAVTTASVEHAALRALQGLFSTRTERRELPVLTARDRSA